MFKKFTQYLKDVQLEMAKVSWPTLSEMAESARIVLILSLVMGVAVFLVDRLLSLGLEQLL